MRPLTDIAIQNFKPKAERYEISDPGCRGLRVAVQPSGHKSFIVRYRDAGGKNRKLTLPPVSLAGVAVADDERLVPGGLHGDAQATGAGVRYLIALGLRLEVLDGDVGERSHGLMVSCHGAPGVAPG